MHRFHRCREILNGFNQPSTELGAWIYLWLRLSALRELDWQRRYNTRPSELGNAIRQLTGAISGKYNSFREKEEGDKIIKTASFIKLALTCVGMGKGDAQQIRDGILRILHRFGIKETNDHFYEQWHQKLHNNTTYDDVGIC